MLHPMILQRLTNLILAAALAVAGCGKADPAASVDPPPPQQPESAIWPLSGQKAEDADSVHAPFGPRALPSQYDFHAGIDIPAARGTPVRAVLSGEVVQVATWNGTSSGAGNSITIRHGSGIATSYLHLHEILVANGARVGQGTVVGTVGSTGATYPHLHLGYFPTLINSARDERESRNPLEILPYRRTAQLVTATFDSVAVVLDVPLRQMTIVSVEVRGEGQTRRVNYYDVVRLGTALRDQQVQSGVHLDAGRPSMGRFTLRLTPVGFRAERVIATAFDGTVLLDAAR
jgi:murein DD-endopeptidase MepM/ murein hydrolase activator NlpD